MVSCGSPLFPQLESRQRRGFKLYLPAQREGLIVGMLQLLQEPAELLRGSASPCRTRPLGPKVTSR